ncbi:MAG TPA: ABC transporter permease [Polyangia bacterium]|nr:ABC transporter permease [Polyangia bacterium]
MKTRALIHLVRQNLARGRRSFFLSLFGISVGIASLAFFLALSAGVRSVVLGQVFPVGQIEVVPTKSSLGDSSLGSIFGGLGGPKPLDDDAWRRLAARPEVKAAYRRAKLGFPSRAWGGQEIIGKNVYTELIAEGVDPAAMAGDELGPERFADDLGSKKQCNADADCSNGEYCPWDTHACEPPIPAVISPFIVEMYNGTIAQQTGLPKVGKFLAGRLRGLTFNIELGRSFIGAAKSATEPHQRKVMLVGISPHAAQLALTLPLGYVQRWNQQYNGSAALSSIVLELEPHADVTRLTAVIRGLGYDVADSGAERAGLAILLVTLLFALVSVATVAVAAINIAHSFFRAVAERRRELGVLRAVGASPADVRSIVLAEAAAIGLGGGIAGLLLARLGAFAIDLASRRFVPDFPFKPDTYFSFGWPLCAGALICSILACMLGAFLPARAAARLEPTEALASP